MDNLYNSLITILDSDQPPLYKDLFSLCMEASDILENEKTDYRPVNSDSNPGSLLDFTGKNPLPVIIVPDIHARRHFLKNILNYRISADSGFLQIDDDITVFEALSKKMLQIVCVGDALHTEKNTIDRWLNIKQEFNSDIYTGSAMTSEGADCFNTLSVLMKLKITFPEHFHFLKGNHENIYNKTGDGDYAFVKIADEGYMLKNFTHTFYGDDILYLISCYEKSLPLIFASNTCVVSHAEPRKAYSKEQLIDARMNPQIIDDLTWTKNGESSDNSTIKILKSLLSKPADVFYFAGHRPVSDNYNFIKEKQFFQIHNPTKQNIILIYDNKPFNPETDIVGVADE